MGAQSGGSVRSPGARPALCSSAVGMMGTTCCCKLLGIYLLDIRNTQRSHQSIQKHILSIVAIVSIEWAKEQQKRTNRKYGKGYCPNDKMRRWAQMQESWYRRHIVWFAVRMSSQWLPRCCGLFYYVYTCLACEGERRKWFSGGRPGSD